MTQEEKQIWIDKAKEYAEEHSKGEFTINVQESPLL
jgi:hypothetical protein